jgi:enoyl-CoA hydratase/carnithine racemase
MPDEPVRVDRAAATTTVTLSRPSRRNALSNEVLDALLVALREAGDSDCTGVVLAAEGPVFSAGHDLGQLADSDLEATHRMLDRCARVMMTIHQMPQVVVARVHALATAAGCQLVAACDLAVATSSASFAVPGGSGGWFCTTPMVEVGRSVPRKFALEMALTGDPIDADTALAWGLVNRVVPDDRLDTEVAALLARATRGSAASRAIGKPTLYVQLGLPLDDAYEHATDVMAAASQIDDAREMMRAFVEHRAPTYSMPPGV